MLQLALASTSEAAWRASPRGLNPRDLAMHVVLPEVDGRIFSGAVAFKEGDAGGPIVSRSVPDRVEAAAENKQKAARKKAKAELDDARETQESATEARADAERLSDLTEVKKQQRKQD